MTLVVSGNLALGTSTTALPLTHPRIGYENLLRGSDCTISTSTADIDHEGESVITGLTYDYWTPTALPGVIAFEFTEAKDVDYCGIAAHTLSSTGNSVELQYYDALAADWVSLGTVQPQPTYGNDVIMFLFDEVSSNIWRLIVSGGTENPALGVVYLGKTLEIERRIYGGHTPITLSKKTTIKPNKSEGGQWLGRSIVREGAGTDIALKNLTAAWVREYFQPFMEEARSYPFFWAWRPGDYPEEIGYVWTNSDIVPSNQGQADLMQVSFSVDGYIR